MNNFPVHKCLFSCCNQRISRHWIWKTALVFEEN